MLSWHEKEVMPFPVFGKMRAAAQSSTKSRSRIVFRLRRHFAEIRNQSLAACGAIRQIQSTPAQPKPIADHRQIYP